MMKLSCLRIRECSRAGQRVGFVPTNFFSIGLGHLITVIVGIESTGGTVQHFIRAMLQYPQIQKRAQEEIDRVIGQERLPVVAE